MADHRPGEPSGNAGFWSGNRATWPLTGLEDSLDEIAAITTGAGLEFSALGGYVPPTRRADAERMLAATAALGAGRVRIAGLKVEPGQTYREAFAACREHWEWVEDKARQYGVQALVELHHETLTPSASAARRLLEGLDPAYVGVIHDIGNLVIEGWEEHGLDLLGEYLAHVHVKNWRGTWPQWKATGRCAGSRNGCRCVKAGRRCRNCSPGWPRSVTTGGSR